MNLAKLVLLLSILGVPMMLAGCEQESSVIQPNDDVKEMMKRNAEARAAKKSSLDVK